jgi:hypothetical protein
MPAIASRRSAKEWARDDPRWDRVRPTRRLDPLKMQPGARFVVMTKSKEWTAPYVFQGFRTRTDRSGIVEACFYDERSGNEFATRVDRWRRFVLRGL